MPFSNTQDGYYYIAAEVHRQLMFSRRAGGSPVPQLERLNQPVRFSDEHGRCLHPDLSGLHCNCPHISADVYYSVFNPPNIRSRAFRQQHPPDGSASLAGTIPASNQRGLVLLLE